MKLIRKLVAESGCEAGNCPTVYLTDRGTLVIQGYVLEPGAKMQLTLPSGESAVEVPAALILDAARQVRPAR
jgi:hypothetical protein